MNILPMDLLFGCIVAVFVLGNVQGQVIEGEYIIAFEDNLSTAEEEEHIERLKNDYGINLIKAFHIGPKTRLYVSGSHEYIQQAKLLPKIKAIDENAILQVDQEVLPLGCHKVAAVQAWGLDRIDQKSPLTGSQMDPSHKLPTYTVGPFRGAGAVAYIVDSGIDVTHPEFQSRAIWAYTSQFADDGDEDLNGHGTHVAGIVGSTSFGVAKEVLLKAVKVVKGDGSVSFAGIMDALAWIWGDQYRYTRQLVVVLAVTGPKHAPTEELVEFLVRNGIIVVASAGNNNGRDACDRSPGGAPGAITVGSINTADKVSAFSNIGDCVDMFAPGLETMSTWPGGQTKVVSGTSMAAAHVAGVVAIKLGKDGPMSPEDMKTWLKSTSTSGILYVDCLVSG